MPGAFSFTENQQESTYFLSLTGMSSIRVISAIIMSILSHATIIFSDFPVHASVASLMVYGFHESTFLQSGFNNWRESFIAFKV